MNRRQPLRIGYIFEGPTDKRTIPELVKQLLERPVTMIPLRKMSSGWEDFRRPSPQDIRAGRRSPRWGMFKSYIEALLIEGAEAIVIVADHDADEDIGHQEPFPHKRWCMLGRNLPFDEKPDLRLVDTAPQPGETETEPAQQRASLCEARGLGPDCFPDCVVDAYEEEAVPVIIGIAKQMLEAWLLAQPEVVEAVLWDPLSEEPEEIPHPKNEIIHRYNGGGDLSRQQAEHIGEHPDFSAAVIEARCPSFARFAEDVRILLVVS
jgi:hypothetical protein